MSQQSETYHLFADPTRYYDAMLEDIEKARDYIYIETYRIGNDTIGRRFNNLLAKKAKDGIEVKILIDAWGGSSVISSFFHELIQNGGVVRFFEKIKYNSDIFTRAHRRNHRKIIVIDDEITYIGSSNLTGYNIHWRESVLRIKGNLSLPFKKVFRQDFNIYNKYIFDKANYIRLIRHNQFEIIRDMPSITRQRIMKKYIQLIRNAEKTITIETPYFLPGFKLRKVLIDAVKRGVEVKVIIPVRSDVGLVDILRNKYLGLLFTSGIQILLYNPHNLHSKLLFIDNHTFSIGSPNFDYRSFRYMYEIILLGNEPSIADQIKEHISTTIGQTSMFNYEQWKRRSLINKFFEWILLPFRHLL
ncbi:MAG: hypothetical protein CVT92_04770 [Bacteroidetes bacterium HGW-Bacteroidetes-1]|jgi:cardiolipin synthase|nr:MAG: hypothetical protein CVT92_04770 [Bacteroidetes bacterium HGW-Bacteroidetes-1]